MNKYKRIRDLREDNDLTQKEMSNILNCSQQVYSNYELGQRDIPTALLIKIADYTMYQPIISLEEQIILTQTNNTALLIITKVQCF